MYGSVILHLPDKFDTFNNLSSTLKHVPPFKGMKCDTHVNDVNVQTSMETV